jgi:amino acid adenylation domain-containing protein
MPETLTGYPLTRLQTAIWNRSETGFNSIMLHFRGGLPGPLFEAALGHLFRRHGILRSRYLKFPEMMFPLRVEDGEAALGIRYVDISRLTEVAKKALADREMEMDTGLFFPPNGHPLRTMVFLEGCGKGKLILRLSRLSGDMRSLSALAREAIDFFKEGAKHGKRPSPPQFSQYQAWIENRDAKTEASVPLLQGFRDMSDRLSAVFPASKQGSDTYCAHMICDATQSWSLVESLAATMDVRPWALWSAYWGFVIGRFLGSSHIAFFLGDMGLSWIGTEELIGPLAGFTPVGFRVGNGEPTRRSLKDAARLVENSLEAGHADADPTLPNKDFLAWQQEGGRVILRIEERILYNCPGIPLEADLAGNQLYKPVKGTLRVIFVDKGEESRLIVVGDPGILHPARIAKLVPAFLSGLESIAPDTEPVGKVRPRQRRIAAHRSIRESNDTARELPRYDSIVSWMDVRWRRWPDKIALVHGQEQISYGTLLSYADAVADLLAAQDAKESEIIAINCPDYAEMIVGILGILKAGCAYLPLESSDPIERAAHCIRDSGCRLALLGRGAVAAIGSLPEVIPIGFPSLGEPKASDVKRTMRSPIWPGGLAYVLYTSGSSGSPKGVLISHHNLLYSTASRENVYPFPAETFLLTSPVSFDSSVAGIYSTLLGGGRLVVSMTARSKDPGIVAGSILMERATRILTLPGWYDVLLDFAGKQGMESLREVVVAGDVCHPSLVEKHRRIQSRTSLFNEYGPTEACVWSTYCQLHGAGDAQTVSIGGPIPFVSVYLMDDTGDSVPDGMEGEIYIGGPGLARAYLNQPKLTAERFPRRKFALGAHARIYRTGDRARLNHKSGLEFLGRYSGYVKINGYRVDPAEIETQMRRHHEVLEIAVIPIGNAGEGMALWAYFTLKDGASLSVEELRSSMSGSLPEYMRPVRFERLVSFPRTTSGKIDRKSLGAREIAAADADAEGDAGSQELETIRSIWKEALGVPRLDIRTDFFSLGGNSLTAARIVAKVGDALGMSIKMQVLLQHPTVLGMTDALVGSRFGALVPDLLATGSATEPTVGERVALSPTQIQYWIHQKLNPKSAVYNMGFFGEGKRRISIRLLEQSLGNSLQRHAILRSRFGESDGLPYMQVTRKTPEAIIRICDLTGIENEARKSLVNAAMGHDNAMPFWLGEQGLLRCRIITGPKHEMRIVLDCHHLVADNWSIGLLWREWEKQIACFQTGIPAQLPLPQFSYFDFLKWQERFLNGPNPAVLKEFWSRTLAGCEHIRWPCEARHEPETGFASTGEFLPHLTVRGLRCLATRHGVTLHTLLLSAFQCLIHFHSGQNKFIIVCPEANRRLQGTVDAVGPFQDILLVPCDVRAVQKFPDHLRSVRDGILAALAHSDLPSSQIASAYTSESRSGRTLTDILFILQEKGFAGGAVMESDYFKWRKSGDRMGKSRMLLECELNDLGLGIRLEYAASILDRNSSTDFLRAFVRILALINEQPGEDLGFYNEWNRVVMERMKDAFV